VNDYETVRIQRDGDVLIATLDRPDSALNAVDGQMHHDLTRLFADLKAEESARAVLLTGSGNVFSAGGDFNWFPDMQDEAKLAALHEDARSLIYDLLDVDLPIVAALNGPAVGLGASIALLCDVVVMAEDSMISDPHVRMGIVAGDGGTVAWPMALGPMLAKRFLLTGDPVTASEAFRLGLAAMVVPSDELLPAALGHAHRLAAGAPLAVQYTKRAINAWIKQVAATSFDLATSLEIDTFRSADHQEALAAWRQKRPPQFEGR